MQFCLYLVIENIISEEKCMTILNLLKSMIFILIPNSISLSFSDSWSFNMISKLGLVGGPGFESPLCNLNLHLFI